MGLLELPDKVVKDLAKNEPYTIAEALVNAIDRGLEERWDAHPDLRDEIVKAVQSCSRYDTKELILACVLSEIARTAQARFPDAIDRFLPRDQHDAEFTLVHAEERIKDYVKEMFFFWLEK